MVGDGVDDLTHQPWRVPAFLLLLSVVGYFAFHAVREDLPEGFLRASMPSFLLPLAMVATIDLAPAIRFHSRRHRAVILTAAMLLATFWFEGIIPLLTDSSTADSRDVLAMLLGSAVAIGWKKDELDADERGSSG